MIAAVGIHVAEMCPEKAADSRAGRRRVGCRTRVVRDGRNVARVFVGCRKG